MKVIDIQGTEVETDDVFVISALWGKAAEMRVGVATHFTDTRMYYEPMRFMRDYQTQKQAWVVIKSPWSPPAKTVHTIEGLIVAKGGGIEQAKNFLRK